MRKRIVIFVVRFRKGLTEWGRAASSAIHG